MRDGNRPKEKGRPVFTSGLRNYARQPISLLRLLGCASVLLASVHQAQAQQTLRNGFETDRTGWVRSGADAPYEEITHVITRDAAHDGQSSEFIQIQVPSQVPRKDGTYIHYQYGIGRGVISEEFSARVWIKANRPGIKLLARVVLPNEPDVILNSRLTTMLHGEAYTKVGHWQQLEIPRPMNLIKAARQIMQAKMGRVVNFDDAYVDALVLNVFAGPGKTDLWIDDLEVCPVDVPVAVKRPAPGAAAAPPQNRPQLVEFNGTKLEVGGRRLFPRWIQHSDTPLKVLRAAGFNTVVLDAAAQPNLVREAMDLGFYIVPQFRNLPGDPHLVSTENLGDLAAHFADNDAAIFYLLGNNLTRQQAEQVARGVQSIGAVDSSRPTGADVSEGLVPFSRRNNFMVGVHRFPLQTSLGLQGYRDWLDQRRRLPNFHPGTFLWTWIQTHLSDTTTQRLYGRPGHDSFHEPVGPQAEQIRLLTYTALGSGFKGIGFWSDRWLADSHRGRDRLLCCAMLNQELDMLDPLLTMDEPPQWVDTSLPEVKAAVLRTGRGALVLPVWMGKHSQYVPGQAAAAKMSITVPQIPQTMQAWEIHPADVRSLRCQRVTGGTKVTLPEFGLTSAILFTADTKLIHRLQEQSHARRQLAAQWSYDLALYELEKIRPVHEQLAALGKSSPEAHHWLKDAETRLRSARDLWESRNFAESYHESQRALRPVRNLMRTEWDKAVRGLDTPEASPFAVSYFTLPRHWQFMEFKEKLAAATNVLPGGDFEIIAQRAQQFWFAEEHVVDDVQVSAVRNGDVPKVDKKGVKTFEPPHGGKQCAKLEIKALPKHPAPAVLENTRISLVSSAVRLQPGTFVQVTGWIFIPSDIVGSPDGALLFDSAGGEDLAVRLTGAMKTWKKFTLYRRIPASGTISVTLALTGLGAAYFDDVTIEPLLPLTNPSGVRLTGQ